jgi:hypothetical protein
MVVAKPSNKFKNTSIAQSWYPQTTQQDTPLPPPERQPLRCFETSNSKKKKRINKLYAL